MKIIIVVVFIIQGYDDVPTFRRQIHCLKTVTSYTNNTFIASPLDRTQPLCLVEVINITHTRVNNIISTTTLGRICVRIKLSNKSLSDADQTCMTHILLHNVPQHIFMTKSTSEGSLPCADVIPYYFYEWSVPIDKDSILYKSFTNHKHNVLLCWMHFLKKYYAAQCIGLSSWTSVSIHKSLIHRLFYYNTNSALLV